MFDERSDKWLSIFKVVIAFLFWASIVAGFILGLVFAEGMGFGGFLLFLVSGVAAAFMGLVFNMIVLQFFCNVQFIRQKMEEKPAPAEASAPKPAEAPAPKPAAAPAPASAQKPAAEKKAPDAEAIKAEQMPDGRIRCPKCNTVQNGNRILCFNCAQKFIVEI